MKATIEELMDRYEIGEILGTGAFSEVKVGRKKETGETFALKIIDRAKCRGKESMIETEVGILAKVRHDNIVQLYEMYEIDTKIYLVMQIVTGGELFDDIVKRGKYTEADASRIVHKILDAVDYLHEMGIAHRDLKPENLLLSDRSSNPRIMLSDFGLSKIFNEDEVMRTACGTPGYVAPEVLRKKGYGKEVDLWSIGVISYILLCGYPPFYDQNNAVLFRQIMAGRYEFDRPWWDNVSEEAKDFIRHLLVLDPRQRYTAKQALGHPFIARERDSAAGWSQTGGAATSSGDSGAIRTESTGKGKAAVISCAQEEKNLAASVTQHLAARANSKNEGKANSAKSVERSEDIGRPISERRDLDDSGCVRSNNDVSQKKVRRNNFRASE
ncbi:kinase-like domain-containing protein [Zopfochytrium polystomum]|nr:kinase-like domain-containing protein [Zopfochytrium polystomum]